MFLRMLFLCPEGGLDMECLRAAKIKIPFADIQLHAASVFLVVLSLRIEQLKGRPQIHRVGGVFSATADWHIHLDGKDVRFPSVPFAARCNLSPLGDLCPDFAGAQTTSYARHPKNYFLCKSGKQVDHPQQRLDIWQTAGVQILRSSWQNNHCRSPHTRTFR